MVLERGMQGRLMGLSSVKTVLKWFLCGVSGWGLWDHAAQNEVQLCAAWLDWLDFRYEFSDISSKKGK